MLPVPLHRRLAGAPDRTDHAPVPAPSPEQPAPAPPHAGPGPWWRVTGERVNHAFAEQRRIDPFGHTVHAWLGALACASVAAPTSAVEFGAIGVVAAMLIRIHRHWRTLPLLFLQPLMLVLLAWTLLALASRLWTLGPHDAWVDEFGVLRFGIVAAALWPVADRRALLLGALVFGFAVAQLSQVVHALGLSLEIDAMTWNRLPGRNSGWLDPVVGGSLLTAALGLHLPAALWGRGRWRVLGALGSAATLLGILATGTRGAWLAAAGLVGIACVVAIARIKPRARLGRAVLILLGIVAVGSAAAWLTVGDQLRARFDAGRAEITGAIELKEFQTDTGARLLMGWWALEALKEQPLGGTGVGGYEAWTRTHVESQGIDPATRRFHAHAHNALLHAAATLGVPGLGLAIAFVALASIGSARRQPGDGPPGYADGPCFALVGLLLVSAFDSVHVNSQTGALLAVLLVFAMRSRPTEPRA